MTPTPEALARARAIVESHRCKHKDCWLDVTNEECLAALLDTHGREVERKARHAALEQAAHYVSQHDNLGNIAADEIRALEAGSQ